MTWIDEAVEREAIPKPSRVDTVEAFCNKHDIAENTYYYQIRKEENRKRILDITLNKAKDEAPEVLKVLVDRAKSGDMRAMDIYVDSILKLAKNLDLKTDGRPLIQLASEIAQKNGITPSTTGDSEGQA